MDIINTEAKNLNGDDFKFLKKHYGEKFAQFCRSNLPTIFNKSGLISKIMEKKFAPNRDLFNDLVFHNLTEDFVNYISVEANNFLDSINNPTKTPTNKTNKTPKELFEMAGYDLFECKTLEDINSFKKYYTEQELLCTFDAPENRLNNYKVFFAVKKDVNKINRKDFKYPKRQDSYGTSVISLQFSKGEYSRLSIKNRYNHSVENPDATFDNNLENIYPGLTESFYNQYSIKLGVRSINFFNIPHYVKTSDGKFYKYITKEEDLHFCKNNVVISIEDNGLKATTYNPDRYELMDHYLLDKKEKTITDLTKLYDGLADSVGKIEKISVVNTSNGERLVTLINDKQETTKLTLNNNNIIKYENNDIKDILDGFLTQSRFLKEFIAPNIEYIGNNFNSNNNVLDTFIAPKVSFVGKRFLHYNRELKYLDMPELKHVDDGFLTYTDIVSFKAEKLKTTGTYFCCSCNRLKNLEIPNIQVFEDDALSFAYNLTKVDFPKVAFIGDGFLSYNENIKEFIAPNLLNVGNYFMMTNEQMSKFEAPNLEKIGNRFLFENRELTNFAFNNLEIIGDNVLTNNNKITDFECPKVKTIGECFLRRNTVLKTWLTPRLANINRFCLENHIDKNINFVAPNLILKNNNSFAKNIKITNMLKENIHEK